MGWTILLAIVGLPLVEVAVFIAVATAIGLLPTLAVAIVLALGGVRLVQRQGLAAARRAQAQMARGEIPGGAAFDGLCLSLAGMLLLIPGLLTDVFGLALLLPPVRGLLRRWLLSHVRVAASMARAAPGVIEGEFVVMGGDDAPSDRPHPIRPALEDRRPDRSRDDA